MALSGSDELERLFAQLVWTLEQQAPDRLSQPIAVAELYEQIVPYRRHRGALKLDSHEDYEMTLLRLLAGERGLAAVTPADVRERLRQEAASVHPDPGAFRAFPKATFRLDPLAVQAVLDAPDAYLPPDEPTRFAPASPAPAAAGCPHCDDLLPQGRAVIFCPHCGADLRVRHCPDCGTQLEREWKFCVTCGSKGA